MNRSSPREQILLKREAELIPSLEQGNDETFGHAPTSRLHLISLRYRQRIRIHPICFAMWFLALAFGACTQEARTPSPIPQQAADTSANIVSPQQPDIQGFHKAKLDSLTEYFYSSYDVPPRALIARFGTPGLAETSRVANKRVEAQSVIYKYGFHGTTVTMHYAPRTKRYRLRNVSTSDIRQLSGFGISQSISPDSLRNLVGQESMARPVRSNTLNLRYEIGLATEVLSFIFHDNLLDSVSYQPFVE